MNRFAIRLLSLGLLATLALFSCKKQTTLATPSKPAGYALRFDGLDDCIRTPNWLPDSPKEFCIEAWLKPAEMNPFYTFVSIFAHRAGGHDKFLRYNHEKHFFIFAAGQSKGAPIVLSSEGKARTGSGWHHVAVSGSAREIVMYIDGAEAAKTSATAAQDWTRNYQTSSIGGDFAPGNTVRGGFRGLMDEVRIWSVARSGDQIRKTMNQSVPPDSKGLAAYWKFDERGGPVVQDASGQGRYIQFVGKSETGQDCDPLRVESDSPVDRPQGPGPAGYALFFDGREARVRTAEVPGLKHAPAFTYEAWLRPMAPLRRACLISSERAINDRDLRLTLEPDGSLSGVIRMQTELTFKTPPIVKPKAWQHLACVYDGSQVAIYVDGESKFTKPGGQAVLFGAPVVIGSLVDRSEQYAGEMDEVRLWNVAKDAAAIKKGMTAPVSRSAEGLAACWRFDESGGQVVVDQSSSLAHGQLGDLFVPEGCDPLRLASSAPIKTAPKPEPRKPVSKGFALSFDGVDDYVDAGNEPDLSVLKAITIEAWIKLDSGSNDERPILAKENATSHQNSYELLLVNLKPRFRVSDGTSGCCGDLGWFPVDGKTAIAPGVWRHIAGVYDGKQIAVYVDGVLDGSTNFDKPLFHVPYTVKIGANATDQRKVFHGQIDEVRLWNRARAQKQLLADMNRSLRGNEPGLIGYWTFDEPAIESPVAGRQQLTLDLSGHNHHAALGGGIGLEPTDPKWVPSDAPVAPAEGK
jgi:hypothetical protein